MAYLVALEAEVFAKLPAAVYVRGFLAEYARALGLDSERVKQTYLARFRAVRSPVVAVAAPQAPASSSATLSAEDTETMPIFARAFGLDTTALTTALTKDH